MIFFPSFYRRENGVFVVTTGPVCEVKPQLIEATKHILYKLLTD